MWRQPFRVSALDDVCLPAFVVVTQPLQPGFLTYLLMTWGGACVYVVLLSGLFVGDRCFVEETVPGGHLPTVESC